MRSVVVVVAVFVPLLSAVTDAFRPTSLLHSKNLLGKTTTASRLFLLNNSDEEGSSITSSRLGRDLEGLKEAASLKETVEAGDTVVCRRDIPESGIYADRGYELQAIFAQRFNDETQQVEKLSLPNLETPIPSGYDERYVKLYNPELQPNGPVVVTPEEVGLVSVRTELIDAAWLAIPGFFWVFVASSFYNIYHERTGGSFMDAFFGR